MKKQIGLTGRVLRGTTLGASLIASTFIALGALGYIGAAAALIAWSGLTAALGIGIWLFVSDIVNAIDLTSGKKIKFGKDKAPRMRTGLGRELRLAIQNTNRSNDGRLRRRERDFEGLELALDSIPGPLFQLTKERYILRANKAAKGLFGGNFEDRDLATVMRSPSLLSAIDDAIEKNIIKLREEKNSTVIKANALKPIYNNKKYDLCFFDPPYDITNFSNIIEKWLCSKIMKQNTIYIYEKNKNNTFDLEKKLNIIGKKQQGISEIIIFKNLSSSPK